MRKANAVIITYDLTNKDGLDRVKSYWLQVIASDPQIKVRTYPPDCFSSQPLNLSTGKLYICSSHKARFNRKDDLHGRLGLA